MTLGVGCVVEPGAIVIVDSARLVYQKDGGFTTKITDDKLLMAEAVTDRDVRIVVAHAGPSFPEIRQRSLPADDDFAGAAHTVWRAFTENTRWPSYVPADHRINEHEALIAGGRPGEPVRLQRWGTDSPPREADLGSLFGIGLASGSWQPRPLRTLVDAIAASMELFTEKIRQAVRDGISGAAAWPAHVAIVTPESVET